MIQQSIDNNRFYYFMKKKVHGDALFEKLKRAALAFSHAAL
jgi:hypothetical protein